MNDYIVLVSEDGQPYISHHGIKGQKWGVRRYQNPDGSLTAEGMRRYNTDSAVDTTKSLHKIERENARLINRRANAVVKANKAYQKGNDKAYEKQISKVKQYDESIDAGKKICEKITTDSSKNGYKVDKQTKVRYTHVGRVAAASLLLTPLAGVALFGVDVYRSNKYGAEAGGFVKGSKYSVERKYRDN